MSKVTTVSFFILGPNDNLEKKISEIKGEHEFMNKNSDVTIEILNETTENCAAGCKMYTYKMELEDKTTTGFSGPRANLNF